MTTQANNVAIESSQINSSGVLQIAGGGTGSTSAATVAGTGISVSGTFPNQTVTNSGVTSIVAGTGISVSGSTGAVTVTNSSPFSITYTANYIIVAGGGSGSGDTGGGGGGGGVLSGTTTLTTSTVYSFTVGAGGAAATSSANRNGNSGSNSTAFSLTAIGGGHGSSTTTGATGGSGGGGANGGSGGAGTSGQGNAGGSYSLWAGAVYGCGGGVRHYDLDQVIVHPATCKHQPTLDLMSRKEEREVAAAERAVARGEKVKVKVEGARRGRPAIDPAVKAAREAERIARSQRSGGRRGRPASGVIKVPVIKSTSGKRGRPALSTPSCR